MAELQRITRVLSEKLIVNISSPILPWAISAPDILFINIILGIFILLLSENNLKFFRYWSKCHIMVINIILGSCSIIVSEIYRNSRLGDFSGRWSPKWTSFNWFPERIPENNYCVYTDYNPYKQGSRNARCSGVLDDNIFAVNPLENYRVPILQSLLTISGESPWELILTIIFWDQLLSPRK